MIVEQVNECDDNPYAIILLGGIVYPFFYEILQSFKQGFRSYFSDMSNMANLLYIFGSIAMSISHLIDDPFSVQSKIIMIFVILLSIVRTFKFMRIFRDFSPIVTMLSQVVSDLQQFMLFYTILILLFSLLWGVIGLGNGVEVINPVFYSKYKTEESRIYGFPGIEYQVIGLFMGNLIDVFRTTVGDYNCITSSVYLNTNEIIMFWLAWSMVVIVGSIIFLNFIIAEASASYEKVSVRLAEYIQKEKANLISESEGMTPNAFKSKHNFPKYIIKREIDS